jgi:hypothetical protein
MLAEPLVSLEKKKRQEIQYSLVVWLEEDEDGRA